MHRARDSALLDLLEETPSSSHYGSVWRVVREGRDPLRCSRSFGRWDDGSVDVLYTAMERKGAIAEMRYHLTKGQPVFPSRVRFELHEIHCRVGNIAVLDFSMLGRLGIPEDQYGRLPYPSLRIEYARTQQIGEAACFIGFDALQVPNARWPCKNIVFFCERLESDALTEHRNDGLVDWEEVTDGA